ncbi:hypothetical protein BE21_53670 [Sorangium cellulosum]|uniref:PGRS family protein n=1 Tax=Sorangium cellulosum TaxID=56 RepID=A0A150TEL3_SORCE|nr:hypothetical protein BE21_53670 [Sorangium cellulosum]
MGMRGRRGRTRLRSVALIVLGCGSASAGAGCSYAEDCARSFTCHPLPGEMPPSLPASPCDGDPATSPAKDGCGVFVARHGDDASDGTREAPVRTLRRAVEKAAEPGGTRRVYACAEDFEEAVVLPSGVAIWGGRDCGAEAWTWGGGESFTGIAPEPGRVPLTVEARQESRTSLVFGVRLTAADAVRPSGSSVGMLVGEGAAVEVVSSEILAGDGADGADGESAPQGEPWRAPDGAGGQKGGDGCLADWTEGAPPVMSVCEDGTTSVGGAGGDCDVAAGGDGEPGAPAPEPGSIDNGERGKGGAMTCTPGEKGGDGAPGANGVGGGLGPEERLNYGSISARGWEGLSGQDGQNGGIGQGGGGGGGVGPNGQCRVVDPQGGPSGGSGGGGGCGGLGGQGGRYGGGSFGIIALHAHVMVDKTEIITGNGGRGGNGGTGQEGGRPGARGFGGQIHVGDTSYSACAGGDGGHGGNGGHGGGGLGGTSIAVARVDSSVHLTESADWAFGAAGAGGLGGGRDPNDMTANGQAGKTALLWDFPELVVPPQ